MIDLLKRVFLHGENPLVKHYSRNILRPPGAVEEARFMALCIRCNRCLEVCPYGSIKRAGLGPTMGTPTVDAEDRGCYLCMACPRLCPTGALDPKLQQPEKVRMGKAVINTSTCYSHLFLEQDVLPEGAGDKIGALCNTCYNVCPLPDEAIRLEKNLFPVVMDGCVGCGVCVERCPVRPERAINVVPTGMGNADEAGFYFRKAKKQYERAVKTPAGKSGGPLNAEELLEKKSEIGSSGKQPSFDFPYEVPKKIEDWD